MILSSDVVDGAASHVHRGQPLLTLTSTSSVELLMDDARRTAWYPAAPVVAVANRRRNDIGDFMIEKAYEYKQTLRLVP